jgi:hypothetical protein
LAASAKKANTASRGSGRLIDVLKSCVDMFLIVVGRVSVPVTKPTSSSLRSLQIHPAPELRRIETNSLKRGFYLE